jgi:outer membrane lipoprotein LolB
LSRRTRPAAGCRPAERLRQPAARQPCRRATRSATSRSTARFALRVTLPARPAKLRRPADWTHQNGIDRILLASPLGYGLAEIETTPELSRLRTADGKTRESADPDALIEDVTGQRLPVTRLPAWLLGRAAAMPNRTGRLRPPGTLREAGWQVDYAYDDETPTPCRRG